MTPAKQHSQEMLNAAPQWAHAQDYCSCVNHTNVGLMAWSMNTNTNIILQAVATAIVGKCNTSDKLLVRSIIGNVETIQSDKYSKK